MNQKSYELSKNSLSVLYLTNLCNNMQATAILIKAFMSLYLCVYLLYHIVFNTQQLFHTTFRQTSNHHLSSSWKIFRAIFSLLTIVAPFTINRFSSSGPNLTAMEWASVSAPFEAYIHICHS